MKYVSVFIGSICIFRVKLTKFNTGGGKIASCLYLCSSNCVVPNCVALNEFSRRRNDLLPAVFDCLFLIAALI